MVKKHRNCVCQTSPSPMMLTRILRICKPTLKTIMQCTMCRKWRTVTKEEERWWESGCRWKKSGINTQRHVVPYIEWYSHATNTFAHTLSNPLTPTFCGHIIRLLITCQHVVFSSPLLAPAVLWCLHKYEPILCLYFTCPIKYLTENHL
jgi:hypothetical protein